MVTEQLEREDKFDVDPGYVVPELTDLLSEGGRIETATRKLQNTYYDTAEADLRRLRLTLRHRVGGPDAGWQLKIPSGAAARTEIHSGSRAKTVPKALADLLLGVRQEHELQPVATLSVTRYVLRLYTAAEELLAEVADDEVQSSTMGDEPTSRSWREVEVELGAAGDERLLRLVGDRLVEWGARRSDSASKLQRALGAVVEEESAGVSTLGDLVAGYVATQCDAIVNGDLGLRLGRNVVHPTRVALRRLRSTLRVFASLFDPQQAADLEAELLWYAGLLGEVRDREVLLRRLLGQVAELPPEQVVGPVASQIERVLSSERRKHLRQVTRAMRDERYQELLSSLADWRTVPPFTDAAAQGSAAAAAFVKRAQRKLERRLRDAEGDLEELHRARKAGKRFRYAAELAEPALGKKATKAVEKGKKLQELLGEHQDSVVSAAWLSRLGTMPIRGENQNRYTYGILVAQEWHRGGKIRDDLQRRYG